jgi:hypothetical protein
LDNKRKEVQTVLDEKRKQLKAIQNGKLTEPLVAALEAERQTYRI